MNTPVLSSFHHRFICVWKTLVIKFLSLLETNGVHKRGLTPRLQEINKPIAKAIDSAGTKVMKNVVGEVYGSHCSGELPRTDLMRCSGSRLCRLVESDGYPSNNLPKALRHHCSEYRGIPTNGHSRNSR